MNRPPAKSLTFRRIILFSAIVPLLAIGAATRADDAKPADKGWESVAAASVTLTRGNSKNFLGTVSINSSRKWGKEEVLLGASGGYGENTDNKNGDTNKTDDYLKGFAQWNHLFTERFYGGLREEAMHDDIAQVNYRFTTSLIAGYFLIKETNTFLSVEAGPSYVYEEVAKSGTNAVNGWERNSYMGIRLGQRFEYKFKNGARVWDTLEWIPQVDEFDNWILNAEIGVSAPINKSLDIRLVAQDSYDNQPADDRKKNDFKLLAGIGFRF